MPNTPERKSEARIKYEVLRDFGNLDWCRIWNAATGVARPIGNPEAVVRYGVPGQGDVTGILYPGTRLEIETKTAKGKQRKAQENYQAMIESLGGIYILARSTDDVTNHEAIRQAEKRWLQDHPATSAAG